MRRAVLRYLGDRAKSKLLDFGYAIDKAKKIGCRHILASHSAPNVLPQRFPQVLSDFGSRNGPDVACDPSPLKQ